MVKPQGEEIMNLCGIAHSDCEQRKKKMKNTESRWFSADFISLLWHIVSGMSAIFRFAIPNEMSEVEKKSTTHELNWNEIKEK